MQGGVKNYLGNQKMVNAPLKWRSGPQHPSTELAYITKKEKDLLVNQDLHGSLKGGVNRGPSGIMSLNGWGSTDSSQNVSGTAASAAETGSRNARDRAEVQAQFAGSGPALPPGVTPKGALDFRAAAINAGAGQRVNPGFFDSRTRLSPYERALAKAYRQDPRNRFAKKAYRKSGQGGIMDFLTGGGFLGNLLRGVGQKFGLGKKWNEPTYDMSDFNKLTLGGVDPFANLDIRDKWDRRKTEEDINIKDTYDFDDVDFDMREIINTSPDGLTEEEVMANRYNAISRGSPMSDEMWGGIGSTNIGQNYNDMNHLNMEIANNPLLKEAINNQFAGVSGWDQSNNNQAKFEQAALQEPIPGLGPNVNIGDPYNDNIWQGWT